MLRLVEAATPSELDLARALFREYQQAIGVDLCFQGFEAELAALPGAYAPPFGQLLLAFDGVAPVGCGAVRPLGPGLAELKRMWTRPEARGRGVARAVATALLAFARQAGHRTIRLDTLEWMTAARSLYASLGFREIGPYYPNPLPGVVYMERTG
ncbi:MAG: GNAT family N-acetyltransferase [Anaeromyxobacter sp.]|nr:GNAT family N-acetyltransferase [Anaeromyxobacter sp.]MBL0275591.1 GNAT family N-acetyltransferase [Anaeromyxobacter sp.]